MPNTRELVLKELDARVHELDPKLSVLSPEDISSAFSYLSVSCKRSLSRRLSTEARRMVGQMLVKDGIAPTRVRLMGFITSLSEGKPI